MRGIPDNKEREQKVTCVAKPTVKDCVSQRRTDVPEVHITPPSFTKTSLLQNITVKEWKD